MTGRIISFFAKHKLLVYTLFVLFTIIVLLLTLLPPDNFDGKTLFQYDKAGHFLMFLGWTLLFGFSWIISGKKPARLWLIFLIGVLFGIGIEFVQDLLPYDRSPSIYDVIANVTGSFTAILMLGYLQRKYRTHLKSNFIK